MDKSVKTVVSKFTPRVCSYDPKCDIRPVAQFGFISLSSCIENGTVPADLSIDETSFNNVDDPSSLLGRPSDVFDAMRKAEYVKKASAESEASSSAEHE